MNELLALLAAGYGVQIRGLDGMFNLLAWALGASDSPSVVIQRDTLPATLAAACEELGVQLPDGTLGSLDAERVGQALGGHRTRLDSLEDRVTRIEEWLKDDDDDDHSDAWTRHMAHETTERVHPHGITYHECGLSLVEEAAALILARRFCPATAATIEPDQDDRCNLNMISGYCPAAYDYAVGQILAARPGPVGDDTLAMLDAPKIVQGAVDRDDTAARAGFTSAAEMDAAFAAADEPVYPCCKHCLPEGHGPAAGDSPRRDQHDSPCDFPGCSGNVDEAAA